MTANSLYETLRLSLEEIDSVEGAHIFQRTLDLISATGLPSIDTVQAECSQVTAAAEALQSGREKLLSLRQLEQSLQATIQTQAQLISFLGSVNQNIELAVSIPDTKAFVSQIQTTLPLQESIFADSKATQLPLALADCEKIVSF